MKGSASCRMQPGHLPAPFEFLFLLSRFYLPTTKADGGGSSPDDVGMPPKDGTPCIAGACRGGFGRVDPGQPRCDWPETSTDHDSGFGLHGDAIAAPASWPCHQNAPQYC